MQSVEFWSTLCDIEMEMIEENNPAEVGGAGQLLQSVGMAAFLHAALRQHLLLATGGKHIGVLRLVMRRARRSL